MNAVTKHNQQYKGQSGHDGGAPDPWGFVAMLLTLKPTATPEQAEKMTKVLEAFPPSQKAIRAFVPCCRVRKCHSSAKKKLLFKLSRVPGIIAGAEKNALEDIVTVMLIARGLQPLQGQAPRGSLERRAQELLEQLGKAGSR